MTAGTEPGRASAPEEGAGLQKERSLAAVSYVLTWLTGLVILLVADREQRYARWHAIQAIGLGIAWAVLATLLGVGGAVFGLLAWGEESFGWGVGPLLGSPFGIAGVLAPLLQLGLIVLIVVLAVKAYRGQTVRLPLIAGIADDEA